MTITEETRVVVNTKNNRLFSIDGMLYFDKTIEEAKIRCEREAQEKVQKFTSYLTEYPNQEEYWKSQIKENKSAKFKIITYKEYQERERNKYLSKKPKRISEKAFYYALEVLPPMNWVTINNVNEFCMSEMLSGVYTNQYAKYNGKYYTKIVDAYDKTTWLHNFLK